MLSYKKPIFLLILISVFLIACGASVENKPVEKNNPATDTLYSEKNTFPEVSFMVFMIDSTKKTGGFGYDILINGERYIHQTNIPAVSGNQFFITAQEAKTAAMFACFKIQNNIMPPTISPHELDSLGITIK